MCRFNTTLSQEEMMTITLKDFRSDLQGRRYADLTGDALEALKAVLALLNDEEAQRRMEDAEERHDRPALAGVVRDIEALKPVEKYLSSHDAHDTVRFRQAVGVAVRIVMDARGWDTTGDKGSVGRRVRGTYENTPGSVSRWFTRSERYRRAVAPKGDRR